MAKHSADPAWIDCHALRRAEQAGVERSGPGLGQELGQGLSRWSGNGLAENEWRPRLRLIEPDGTEHFLPSDPEPAEQADAAALERDQKEAREREEALAAEQERAEAEAEARAAEEKERREAEAEAKAKKEAEEKAQREAEAKAKQEAEEKARREAEAKAKKEAEEKARREAEEKAQREAEAKAKNEAAEKARLKAEAKAKQEAEEKAQREAEAKAKQEAEEKARREAEAKAEKEAEEKARREAEAKAKKAAEEKARREAEAKAEKEAEEKAQREAEAKAKKEAEENARREAQAKAKKEAEEKAQREAEAKANKEPEAKPKKQAARKGKSKEKSKPKPESGAAATDPAELSRHLGESYRKLIASSGPISLAQYMGESNARYYASRDPLGDEGDFITAPEVSQMFGELIGLWVADLWVKMGMSDRVQLVELGPGRGTLMKDAQRALGRYGFEQPLHFIEGSPALRAIQKEAFPEVIHHDDLSTLPDDLPLIIIANEFFDALPIHQLIRSATGWHERMIGLESGQLAFVAGSEPMDDIVPPSWTNASQGTMIETSTAAAALMQEISERLANQGGAALIIDYGPFEARSGSTLQALKDHKHVDPLSHPGEADITAHVDFELLQHVARVAGADVMGIEMQGDWLREMGIETRVEALQARDPDQAETLERQFRRLAADDQMGTLFKVLGIAGRRWPMGFGFS